MKHWYASKGIWGGVFAILAPILASLGYAVTEAEQANLAAVLAALGAAIGQADPAVIAGAAGSVVSGILSIIGRVRATGPIARSRGAGAANLALAFLVLAAVGPLAACASSSGVAETPAQRLFAAKADYGSLLGVMVAYKRLPACAIAAAPCSDPDVVEILKRADNDAAAILDAAAAVVRDPAATESAVSAALASAKEGLEALRKILLNHGVLTDGNSACLCDPYPRHYSGLDFGRKGRLGVDQLGDRAPRGHVGRKSGSDGGGMVRTRGAPLGPSCGTA